jgi:hypothetical protein
MQRKRSGLIPPDRLRRRIASGQHGATPTTAMPHIAIQERLNGKVVDWLEHVTDEQYRK